MSTAEFAPQKSHWDRTPQEWREACGCPDWTDEQAVEFGNGIKRFVNQFLDEIFRDEFLPDDL